MKRTLILSTLLTFVSGTQVADAAPMFFTSRTAFNNAVAGGAGALSFESFERSFSASASVAFNDFTVSESGGANVIYQLRTTTIGGLSNAITDGTGAIGYVEQSGSQANFFSFNSAINAFGIDVTSSRAGSIAIGGDVSTTMNIASADSPTFFGVIDFANTFTSLTFNYNGTANLGWDSASYGLAAPVPEPASAAIWALGALGVCVGVRRLKNRRV